MGFMSARSFRQIATSAGESYLNKRQTMRDKIEELSEKASKRGAELQEKYNTYYDEEKANINNFKTIATLAGEEYVPALNSFVGTDATKLKVFNNVSAEGIRKELDKYKNVDTKTNFIEQSSENISKKKEELDSTLLNEFKIPPATASFFTKGIAEKGMQEIRQSSTGNITEGEAIDTNFTAGPGMGTDSFVSQKNFSDNIDYYYNTLKTPRKDGADRLVKNDDGSQVYDIAAGQEGTIARIDKQAKTIIENGFEGSLDEAIANVIEKGNNQNYNLPFLTTAVEGSPIDVELTGYFNQFKEKKSTSQMQSVIDELKERGLMNKANTLQTELDNFIKTINDEPQVETNIEPEVPAKVEPRPPKFGGGAEGKAKREAWESQYGNTHFDDGTLMSPAQQEAWKESQAKKGGGKSKKSIRRLITEEGN